MRVGSLSSCTSTTSEEVSEVLHGMLYLSYAEIVDLRAERGLTRAHMELVAAREATVAGIFQMMNRLVDATGVPIGASLHAIAADLGLDPGDAPD